MTPVLLLPVKDIKVTQPFGTSFTWYDPKKKKYVDFYKNLGYAGHMGIDFLSINQVCLASHDGIVTRSVDSPSAGKYVEITKLDDSGNGFKTLYCHLESYSVKNGDRVKQGQIIGITDNTGIYTTGSHLHFELKLIRNFNEVIDNDNGFGGAIDPSEFFVELHGNKWYEPASYHRYGRRQEWLAEFNMRFKNIWLHKTLGERIKMIYDTKFINKLVYGGYSYEEAINPAMDFITNYLKKDDYKRGMKPFQKYGKL